MKKSNSTERTDERTNPLSRRRFLHYAAGAAGAALALPRRGLGFAPAGQTVSPDAEAGTVILDGMMLTYFTFPPSVVTSTFTASRSPPSFTRFQWPI
jgi:hypothetical protein